MFAGWHAFVGELLRELCFVGLGFGLVVQAWLGRPFVQVRHDADRRSDYRLVDCHAQWGSRWF